LDDKTHKLLAIKTGVMMTTPNISDAEFMELWKTHQSAAAIHKLIGGNIRTLQRRRANLETKYGLLLEAKNPHGRPERSKSAYERKQLGVLNGVGIVFSDAHYWPGIVTTAHKALLWAIKEFKPSFVVCNGDALDGASISRFSPSGVAGKEPTLIEELKACQERLSEVEEAAKEARHNVKLIYTWGNHDARFNARLATNAPQFAETYGFKLEDHFPTWEFCMTCWPTEDVVIKHRYKGGVHATHNNTATAGKSIVTGHLHSLKVTPYADYNGNRFGVDTGTLAEPYGPQFSYGEDNPLNHRSGFAILTFKDGKLLWPELVHKWDEDQVEFRGQIINVS
jgi:Calcineurin-like phosphoesterase